MDWLTGSIRARMTLAFALSIVAVMLLACLGLIGYAQRAAERSADDILRSAQDKVRHELTDSPIILDPVEVGEVEGDLSDEHLSLLILNTQGRVLAHSGSAAFAGPLPARRAAPAWRTVVFPIGPHTVVIGLPWERTQRALNSQALLLLALSLVTGGAATLGAWLLVGRTLLPIRRLSQQAQSASAAPVGVQLVPPSRDAEVVELVATLNHLLTCQGEAAAARGRFYAAASHELRTPLQALSGHLELALQRPRTQEEYLAVVQEAEAQTRRLTSLVRDLLRLHQLESPPRTPQEPVDLAEVCARTLQTFAPLIEARALTVHIESPAEAIIAAIPTHADMLARNLVENALQYATYGSQVRLSLMTRAGSTQLELWNECAVPADWQPERLLEAFYRPDRSRHARTGGNGLGLALCKAIADGNGWRLSLRREGAYVVARVVTGA